LLRLPGMKQNQNSLSKVLLNILTERLLIPVILLSILLSLLSSVIASIYIRQDQLQATHSISLRLDDFLKNAEEAILSAGKAAQLNQQNELPAYLAILQEANPYFDTIYLISKEGKIYAISPNDPLSIGLDMSNQDYYRNRNGSDAIRISPPFISTKTGALTVFISQQLPTNHMVVGELSLSKLQQVVRSESYAKNGRVIFITDGHGTVLGHPDFSLVAQQVNFSYLNQEQFELVPDSSRLIFTRNRSYIQTISPLNQIDWFVIAQIPLFSAFAPFLFFALVSVVLIIGLWLLVLYSIRQEAQKKVIAPLGQLGEAANSLAVDDGSRINQIATTAAFDEIQDLAINFLHMVEAVEQRQVALEERTQSEHELRLLAESLRDTAAALNSTLDYEIVLERILTNIGLVIPHDFANIMLIDPEQNIVRVVAEYGYAEHGLQQWIERTTFTMDELKTLARMYHTSTPILITNTTNNPMWVVYQESNMVRSYMGAPIRIRGQVIGFINLDSLTPGFYTPDMMDKLQSFADQAGIAIHNAELIRDLQDSHQELIIAYDTTIQGWAKALELRDMEIQGHSIRVAEMTVRLATYLGITEPDLTHIRYGAFLHDIGKIAIPDSILYKKAALTDEEWEIMRMHPIYAQQILAPIPYLSRSVDIPYYHHEHWDGSGYPHKLRGEQIPLAARIFSIVDVWDSLRRDRPYHSAWHEDEVYTYLRSQSGKLFDPRLVNEFLQMLKDHPDLEYLI